MLLLQSSHFSSVSLRLDWINSLFLSHTSLSMQNVHWSLIFLYASCDCLQNFELLYPWFRSFYLSACHFVCVHVCMYAWVCVCVSLTFSSPVHLLTHSRAEMRLSSLNWQNWLGRWYASRSQMQLLKDFSASWGSSKTNYGTPLQFQWLKRYSPLAMAWSVKGKHVKPSRLSRWW